MWQAKLLLLVVGLANMMHSETSAFASLRTNDVKIEGDDAILYVKNGATATGCGADSDHPCPAATDLFAATYNGKTKKLYIVSAFNFGNNDHYALSDTGYEIASSGNAIATVTVPAAKTFAVSVNTKVTGISFTDAASRTASLFAVSANTLTLERVKYTGAGTGKENTVPVISLTGTGSLEITSSEFSKVYLKEKNGAAINSASSGSITIESSLFSECTAIIDETKNTEGHGGAIYISDEQASSTLTLKDSVFFKCTADLNGGAIYAYKIKEMKTDNYDKMKKNVFRECTAGANGGAIYVESANAADLQFYDMIECTAGENGGAAYFKSVAQPNLCYSWIAFCTAENGGAVYLDGCNNVEGNTFSYLTCFYKCKATKNGGAVYTNSGISQPFEMSVFIGASDKAAVSGGAVYWEGSSNAANLFQRCGFAYLTADSANTVYFSSVPINEAFAECYVIGDSDGVYVQGSGLPITGIEVKKEYELPSLKTVILNKIKELQPLAKVDMEYSVVDKKGTITAKGSMESRTFDILFALDYNNDIWRLSVSHEDTSSINSLNSIYDGSIYTLEGKKFETKYEKLRLTEITKSVITKDSGEEGTAVSGSESFSKKTIKYAEQNQGGNQGSRGNDDAPATTPVYTRTVTSFTGRTDAGTASSAEDLATFSVSFKSNNADIEGKTALQQDLGSLISTESTTEANKKQPRTSSSWRPPAPRSSGPRAWGWS